MKIVKHALTVFAAMALLNGCTRKAEQAAPAPEATPAVESAPTAAPGQDLGNTNAAPAEAGGTAAPAGTN